jgi:GNAT superfamily N-acetyltransferase
LVVDRENAIVAAVVVTRFESQAAWWPGGPWVAEMFVIPRLQQQGIGSRLLSEAAVACRAARFQWLGLTVSDANPAKRLYERFGFWRARTHWAIER